MKTIMRIFSVVLLVMVGTVFAVGPAGLISLLIGNQGGSATYGIYSSSGVLILSNIINSGENEMIFVKKGVHNLFV